VPKNQRLFLTFLLCLLYSASSYSGDQQQQIPKHAVILLYHHVSDSSPASTSISPILFEQQLQHLEQQQFLIWPLEKIIARLKSKRAMPDNVVAITFDDNYRSVYSEAFPRLKKRNWPFTIFISSDAIDQGYNYQSSWEQLRTMAASGATIANHSASHRHLLKPIKGESTSQWQQRITEDLLKNQQRINQEIGSDHKLFAYPYGEFNSTLKKQIKQLGFYAFGQHSGAMGEETDKQAIPRFPFAGNYNKLEDFALKIRTLPLAVNPVSSSENPLSHQQTKPTLSLEFLTDLPAKALLQCFGSQQGRLIVNWNENVVNISPKQAIPTGRSRYNCTLEKGRDRFYWFSYPWLRLEENDQWPVD
jgi:peptidoglycan/xylan/chitin deacetylase (PgdA/CDA1 family)